jgi:hypothetical protein
VRSQVPDPDNRVPGQTAQAFWMDIWVPADAQMGKQTITATLWSGKDVGTGAKIVIMPE